MEANLPDVFSAAGLMVPEPSTMAELSIPLMEDDVAMVEAVIYIARAHTRDGRVRSVGRW